MQTKRDQLRAYQFVVRRMKSAMLRAHPDSPEMPLRRSGSATFAGIVAVAIGFAGATVWGFLFPGNSRVWRDGKSVIVQKETGARYVYLAGTLHPVLNYTSARLILGPDARIVTVSAKSLRDVPRGIPLGIPGAPDALPRPADLLTTPWLVCAPAPAAGGTPTDLPRLVVLAGDADRLPSVAQQGALVRVPDGTVHLAWAGQRFRVPGRATLVALGLDGAAPVPVPLDWLNALPAGSDLAAPRVPDLGRSVSWFRQLPKARVGQVVLVDEPGIRRQAYLVVQAGLAPISDTMAALLLGAPATARAYVGLPVAARPVLPSMVSAVPVGVAPGRSTGWPDRPPTLDAAPAGVSALCVRIAPQRAGTRRATVVRVESEALAPFARHDGGRVVAVRPGAGVLAAAAHTPDGSGSATYLITDIGIKYPVSADARRALGQDTVTPVVLPPEVLDLVPGGPVLDPAAARVPQPPTTVADQARGP